MRTPTKYWEDEDVCQLERAKGADVSYCFPEAPGSRSVSLNGTGALLAGAGVRAENLAGEAAIGRV